jgi:hypothetical protein
MEKVVKKYRNKNQYIKDRRTIHQKIESDRQDKKPIVYKLNDERIKTGKEIKEIATSYPVNVEKYTKALRKISNVGTYILVPNSWIPCYVEYDDKIMYISTKFLSNSMFLLPKRMIEDEYYLMRVYRFNNVFRDQEQLDFSLQRYENHLKSYAKNLFNKKGGIEIESI